jgi:diphthamide biosynthesis protein 2
LPDDLRNDADSHTFLYIGNRNSFLNPFLFYLNKNAFFKLETSGDNLKLEPIMFAKTNRELMRRFYLIEKARDARIFGILIGTMSVANYKEAIDHVSQILKKAGRRFYSFLIGKLNCPKLNNFMEIDMYVMVACNENSLINSKELNKPIITIYELEMAFNATRMWGEEFVCDFRQLLPGQEHYMPLKLSELESDVSLITGGSRVMTSQADENGNISAKNNSALTSRDDGLSVIHYAAAGLRFNFYTYSQIFETKSTRKEKP